MESDNRHCDLLMVMPGSTKQLRGYERATLDGVDLRGTQLALRGVMVWVYAASTTQQPHVRMRDDVQ